MGLRILAALAPIVAVAAIGVAAAQSMPLGVVDPPSIDVSGPATVEAASPTGGALSYTVVASGAYTCDTPNGTPIPLDSSVTVTCALTSDPSVVDSLTQTAVDTTPPVLVLPDLTATAGATVTYTPGAIDAVDTSVSVTCVPPSGFVATATVTVTCTATDDSGNSAQGSFTVTVSKPPNTPPTLNLPGTITVEATGSAGAVVTYTVGATDAEDAPDPTPTCSPASGSRFPLGTTTVECSVTDSGGLSASGSFDVTVADTTPPVVTIPGSRTVEANGPDGSIVNYPEPTASDTVDGPLPAFCDPPSGSLFPLGATTVECSALDSDGNVGAASFLVTVRDTTPPTVTPPADIAIVSDSPVSSKDPRIVEFLQGATAEDIVDPDVVATALAPEPVPLGTTTITFIALDDAGNLGTATSTITIGPDPAPPPDVDRTPPANVRNVKATTGDRTVSVVWKRPPDKDYAGVEITRSPGKNGEMASVVFTGRAKSFLDRKLTPGVEYRYVIVTLDTSGNRSAGVAVVALARDTALVSPEDGAVLRKPFTVVWEPVKSATYYNIQAYLGTNLLNAQALQKVLSAWPTKPSYAFKKVWRYDGKVRRLKPGTYTVYVWPGFGKKSAARYGDLLFRATFVIVRR